jgi:hypothetical protein
VSLETPKKSCEFCPPNGDKCGICGSSFSLESERVMPSKARDFNTPVAPIVFLPVPFIEQRNQSSSAMKTHIDTILSGLNTKHHLTVHSRHTYIFILAVFFGLVLISFIPIYEWRSQQFKSLAITEADSFMQTCLKLNLTGKNLRDAARSKFKQLSEADIALVKAGVPQVEKGVLEELGKKIDLTHCEVELNKLDILSVCVPRVLEKAFDLRVQSLLANQTTILPDEFKLWITECKLNLDELSVLYKTQLDNPGLQRIEIKKDWLENFSKPSILKESPT